MVSSLEARPVGAGAVPTDGLPSNTKQPALEETFTENKAASTVSPTSFTVSAPTLLTEPSASAKRPPANETQPPERLEEGKVQRAMQKKGIIGTAETTIRTSNNGEAHTPSSPPRLPDEPLPDEQDDDGWDPVWSDEHRAWYFFNRITQQAQWTNPRVPDAEAAAEGAAVVESLAAQQQQQNQQPQPVAGGYNPAIHGDYDPNAWYATRTVTRAGATGGHEMNGGGVLAEDEEEVFDNEEAIAAAAAAAAVAIQQQQQQKEAAAGVQAVGTVRDSNHDATSGRQLNAYFDVAAAGSAHGGRSLKAERSGKKPSRSELKAFKEKRRAKKEEKRRAWLRD